MEVEKYEIMNVLLFLHICIS